MLTALDAPVLHVFPMYGHWQATDYVFALPCPRGVPLSLAYEMAVREELEMTLLRDVVFTAISMPEFRADFADAVVYAQPFALHFCAWCGCDRYFVDTSRHPAETAGAMRCDVCMTRA